MLKIATPYFDVGRCVNSFLCIALGFSTGGRKNAVVWFGFCFSQIIPCEEKLLFVFDLYSCRCVNKRKYDPHISAVRLAVDGQKKCCGHLKYMSGRVGKSLVFFLFKSSNFPVSL